MKETLIFQLREGEEFIPLIQLLKAVNVVYSGSDAQECVSAGNEPKSGKGKPSSSTATGLWSKAQTAKRQKNRIGFQSCTISTPTCPACTSLVEKNESGTP